MNVCGTRGVDGGSGSLIRGKPSCGVGGSTRGRGVGVGCDKGSGVGGDVGNGRGMGGRGIGFFLINDGVSLVRDSSDENNEGTRDMFKADEKLGPRRRGLSSTLCANPGERFLMLVSIALRSHTAVGVPRASSPTTRSATSSPSRRTSGDPTVRRDSKWANRAPTSTGLGDDRLTSTNLAV